MVDSIVIKPNKKPIEIKKNNFIDTIITKETPINKILLVNNKNNKDNIIKQINTKYKNKVIQDQTLTKKDNVIIKQNNIINTAYKPIGSIQYNTKDNIIMKNTIEKEYIEKPVEKTIIKKVKVKNRRNVPNMYSF